MKRSIKKFLSLFLCLCFLTAVLVPNTVTKADALTFAIDDVDGSQWSTGASTVWTTGTFTAQYWVVLKASKVSYNVYKVTQIYGVGVKSVAVSGTDILVCVHSANAGFDNASKVAIGDTLSLYNITLRTKECNGGYVRVSSSYGITLSVGSTLGIDHASKRLTNVGYGTTAAALKTHITEATADITVKNTSGTVIADTAPLGTGYTVKTGTSAAYTVVVPSDVDGNANISGSDYLALQAHLCNVNALTGVKLAAADSNNDGNVTAADTLDLATVIKGGKDMEIKPLQSVAKTEPPVIEREKLTLNYHSRSFKASETAGTHSNTVISNGKLTLASGATSGYFTTNTVNIGTFKTMLMSWNAQTNGGKVSMSVSYEVNGGTWSGYLNWGTWSSASGVSGSKNNSNAYGSVDIDILSVASGYTTTGNIKIRCTITAVNGKVPVVDGFAVATPTMAKQQTVTTSSFPSAFQNNIANRSQMAAENGSIGNIICSPTSTAMAVEHMGTKVTSLTAARAMYDNVWGAYGNWSFACAYAGEHGYVAYLDFYDVNMMKYALSQGCVIGCSTNLTSSGHIVLMSGYKVVNGVEYFVCNDPNISGTSTNRTDYTVSYFSSVWQKSSYNNLGVVYVFQKVHDLNG